jgi:hypothetical protein
MWTSGKARFRKLSNESNLLIRIKSCWGDAVVERRVAIDSNLRKGEELTSSPP